MNIITDLRSRFGGVRDQGQRPTCLAMSTSDLHGCRYGLELSAEYLSYYCVRRMTPPDPHAGLFVEHVTAALAAEGQPLESAWPYLLALPSQPNAWIPPESPGQVWRCDIRFRKAAVAEVTDMLRNCVSVVLGLSLTTSFFTPDIRGYVFPQQGDIETPHRHAVVAVAVGHEGSGEEYVLVRNSWGTNWGLNGHAWVSSRYLNDHLLWIGCMSGVAQNETH